MSVVRSIFKSGLFANKIAIVTGGGSGIGEGIAKELANLGILAFILCFRAWFRNSEYILLIIILFSKGCSVLICSRKPERLSAAVERIIKSSECSRERVSFLKCNIRSEVEVWVPSLQVHILASASTYLYRHYAQVQDMMKECVRRYGAINFLVNNGGGQFASHAEDIKLKGISWSEILQLNTGDFYTVLLIGLQVGMQWSKRI